MALTSRTRPFRASFSSWGAADDPALHPVELERQPILHATVEVVATDIADARLKALVKAQDERVWNRTTIVPTRVCKITAHGGKH
jgi:hypothetical protein